MEQQTERPSPQETLAIMMAKDRFSQWLGLQVDEMGPGYCRLHYTVRDEMLNGFDSLHGGVMFSASDSAFAFACNTHGFVTVALDVSITFTRAVSAGERLTVEAKELHRSARTGLYDIRTTNGKGELVCVFKGTGYQTSRQIMSDQ